MHEVIETSMEWVIIMDMVCPEQNLLYCIVVECYYVYGLSYMYCLISCYAPYYMIVFYLVLIMNVQCPVLFNYYKNEQ